MRPAVRSTLAAAKLSTDPLYLDVRLPAGAEFSAHGCPGLQRLALRL